MAAESLDSPALRQIALDAERLGRAEADRDRLAWEVENLRRRLAETEAERDRWRRRVLPPDEMAAATEAVVRVTAGGISFGKPSKRNTTKVSAGAVAEAALVAAAEVRALRDKQEQGSYSK